VLGGHEGHHLHPGGPVLRAHLRLHARSARSSSRNFIETVHQTRYQEAPAWFRNWENIGLIGWLDKNGDGAIQYGPGAPFEGRLSFDEGQGANGERRVSSTPTKVDNEVYVDRDIMVLANPEIANLPGWVVALVAAGGLAAALSTAAGLLLVISTSISHDLLKKTFRPKLSEKRELLYARLSAATAIGIAGYLGINPPGFVAQVVAFAFGLAAASLFPAIFLGIFSRRMNTLGAVAGMCTGLSFTSAYIVYFKFIRPGLNSSEYWWFGISPEGIGVLGMLINFGVALTLCRLQAPPPFEIQELIDDIRVPAGAKVAHDH
jgi:cation/acetate symporter